MHENQVLLIGRDLLTTLLLLAGPAIGVSLLVGLLVSLFQALTSLQEQTLSFAPRIFAVGVVMLFTLPWMIDTVRAFTIRMFTMMTGVTQ